MAKLKLSPRLSGIAGEIAKLGTQDMIYEIGADHAYLPIYLVQEGACAAASASDISEKSLRRAVANASERGFSGRIKFYPGDGFSAFTEYITGKIVIIAGIGGVKLAEILAEGAERAKLASLLILQPMHNHEALRKWLWENAFEISYELLVPEGRRIYSLLFCKYAGAPQPYAQTDLYAGKKVLYANNGEYLHFLRFTLRKITNRLDGVNASAAAGNASGAVIDERKRLEAVTVDIKRKIMELS